MVSMNKGGEETVSAGRKPLYIGLLVIALIIILVLVYFGTKTFAGKAIAIDSTLFEPGTGGAEPLSLPRNAGELVTVYVGANLGAAESVGYKFTIIPDRNVLEFVSAVSLIPEWGDDFWRVTTSDGELTVEHATLDYNARISGPLRLAEVTYRVKGGQQLNDINVGDISLDSLFVYNLNPPHANILTGTIAQSSGTAACPASTADADSCGAFCTENTATYCPPATSSTGYTTDINGDGTINGQDAFIILKIAESKVRSECGVDSPCEFGSTYICDDGSFRVDGYHGYTHVAGAACPFADMADYVRGS